MDSHMDVGQKYNRGQEESEEKHDLLSLCASSEGCVEGEREGHWVLHQCMAPPPLRSSSVSWGWVGNCPGLLVLSLDISPAASTQQLPRWLCPTMVQGCETTDPSHSFQEAACWPPPCFLLACVTSLIRIQQPLNGLFILWTGTPLQSSRLQKRCCGSQGNSLWVWGSFKDSPWW